MENSTITSNFTGLELGRFSIMPPLRVDVQELGKDSWLAQLLPERLTDYEWGYGETLEEAVADLASSVEEMWELFQKVPAEKLGHHLLIYKQTLQKYAVVHTTNKGESAVVGQFGKEVKNEY